ncbi:MAG: glutamine amidotransferase [bacterium]|nr:glutamine amidotransferase [bacterium]MDZ4247658.1 glutamine amidotransferase [Patescibacteria group bacterium]
MHLRIAHLYPRRMSIYGDRGNVMTLVRRARWRDVAASVDEIECEDRLEAKRYDLFFFGGGQDQEQDTVARDLAKKGPAIAEAIRGGAAALAVCGGYQLFGRHYQPADGERLDGIGVFDVHTEAPGGAAAKGGTPERFVGNVVAAPDLGALGKDFGTTPLVGFENHSGLTFLGETARPLAHVRRGHGNNGRDRTEGCVAGSAVGTYLHGSLLPKNPHLADWLITRALRRRYKGVRLRPLEDSLERTVNESLAAGTA